MQKSLYETHNIAKNHLPFIFHHDKYTKMNAEFFNWHENIEIIQHISGEGYVLIDSNRYEIKNGGITVINSNSLHAFGTESMVEYDCLIIDRLFFIENGIDIDKFSFTMAICSDELSRLYSAAANLIDRSRTAPEELDPPKIRAALLAIILELCENHCAPKMIRSQYVTEKIKEVISFLHENVDSPLTLDEISRQAKMSKYYLCREFKHMTGTTIFEFINIIRCREAKRKISNGASVSEAAFSVGFESLSYFTKKFKEINGKLPSEYKNDAE